MYSNEDKDIEPQFKLIAKNGQALTFIEVLYGIYKNIYPMMKEQNRTYLEMLHFFRNESIDYPNRSVYFLLLGS
jgi:hypothetical protein